MWKSTFFLLLVVVGVFAGADRTEIPDDVIREVANALSMFESGAQYTPNVRTQGWSGDANNTEDKAPKSLLYGRIDDKSAPSYTTFIALLDSFEKDVAVEETPNEELATAFIDAIMKTEQMDIAFNFLASHGYCNEDREQFKKQLLRWWFGAYSRFNGVRGSSGFEHVFVGETKNDKAIGLHNYLQFGRQEKLGNLNYLGYIKYQPETHIRLQFEWFNLLNKKAAMFLGTSPELEMALYTICFRLREDKPCPVTVHNKDLLIYTRSIKEGEKTYVKNAYPH